MFRILRSFAWRTFPWQECIAGIIAWLVLMALVAFADGSPDDDARAAIALALAQRPLLSSDEDLYDAAAVKATREKLPLVIFVGVQSRPIEGAVSVMLSSHNGNKVPRLIVGQPGTIGRLLSPGVGDAEIRNAFLPAKVVSPPALTFQYSQPTSGRSC